MKLLKLLLAKLLNTNTKKSKTNLQQLLIDDIKIMIYKAYLLEHLQIVKDLVDTIDDLCIEQLISINAHIEFHQDLIKKANYKYYQNSYQHAEIMRFISNADTAPELDTIRIHILSNRKNYATIALILYSRMIELRINEIKNLQFKKYQND